MCNENSHLFPVAEAAFLSRGLSEELFFSNWEVFLFYFQEYKIRVAHLSILSMSA